MIRNKQTIQIITVLIFACRLTYTDRKVHGVSKMPTLQQSHHLLRVIKKNWHLTVNHI